MEYSRLSALLSGFSRTKIVVIGDYCLDKYLYIEPSLDEISRETGLVAYQASDRSVFPGASGNVCRNLTALGAGEVHCIGLTGMDGDGYELRRELEQAGCDISGLIDAEGMMTPTYIKPMRLSSDGYHEMSRIDIRSRCATPRPIQNELIARLDSAIDGADAIVILDQFDQPDEGVVSSCVLEHLAALGKSRPELFMLCDSRAMPDRFRSISVKCNNIEIASACGESFEGLPDLGTVRRCGLRFLRQSGRPVFVTLGADGIMSFEESGVNILPTVKVEGPIDICGAGDTVTAALTASVCSGASASEAALIGNIAASVTIRKLGVTGTATQSELIAAAASFGISERR